MSRPREVLVRSSSALASGAVVPMPTFPCARSPDGARMNDEATRTHTAASNERLPTFTVLLPHEAVRMLYVIASSFIFGPSLSCWINDRVSDSNIIGALIGVRVSHKRDHADAKHTRA